MKIFLHMTIRKIEDLYFISYTDKKSLTWCFDVRSVNKLLELEDKNPYTR